MTLKGKSPKHAKRKRAKIVVHGLAGVGKTWQALDFPNCYYIDTEGGATRDQYIQKLEASKALYMGQEDGAGDLATVIREVRELCMSEHDRKTLVIDSYSKIYNNAIAAEEERLTEAGEKLAFGNEKKPAVKLSRRLVTWLDRLDMNVILICHQRALWRNGEEVGATFDGWDKLSYELDLTLQIERMGPVRKAIVKKSRLEGFEDGSSFDWSYDEFARRYGREAIEGKVTSLKQASAEQVQQLGTLLDAVKVDDATLVKWREKAGVDTWAEMDSDTIQKCIDSLKKKVA